MNGSDLGALFVLALAAYRTTVLIVKDWVPFGAVRDWVWQRFPYASSPETEDSPARKATKFGYLLTCQWCAGLWNCAGWWAAWRLWPRGTILVAVLFAMAGLQGTLAVVVDRIEGRPDDEE